MPSATVHPDLVLMAVRACSTSAGGDQTIRRLLDDLRGRGSLAGPGGARPASPAEPQAGR